jgi:hypothetical protein
VGVLTGRTVQAHVLGMRRAPPLFPFLTPRSVLLVWSGAVKEDGRGPSIWDKFSHTKNKVRSKGLMMIVKRPPVRI